MSKIAMMLGVLFTSMALTACSPSPQAKKELQELQEKCKKDATNPECTANKGGPN